MTVCVTYRIRDLYGEWTPVTFVYEGMSLAEYSQRMLMQAADLTMWSSIDYLDGQIQADGSEYVPPRYDFRVARWGTRQYPTG